MFKFKKKRKLITDENTLFLYLRDCMLNIYSDEYSQEDIEWAWSVGCDEIQKTLQELKEINKGE